MTAPVVLPSGRTLREVAKAAGISPGTAWARLRAGWTEGELALPKRTQPRPALPANSKRHGHAAHHGRSGEFRSWVSMRDRCSRLAAYMNVPICERWRTFEHFLADMGERPAGTTLDRIDNDKGYEPGNCRWATRTEQSRNRRVVRRLSHPDGRVATLPEWAEAVGIARRTLYARVRSGRTIEEAIRTPLHAKNWRAP